MTGQSRLAPERRDLPFGNPNSTGATCRKAGRERDFCPLLAVGGFLIERLTMKPSQELLAEYLTSGSEAAFVTRLWAGVDLIDAGAVHYR